MSIEFLITTLIIVVAPGTGVIYTIGTGLAQGRSASALAALACTLGIVPHLAAAMLGLAAVLHASALVFNAIKYVGILYLLYMAWQCLRDRGVLNVEGGGRRPGWKILRDGILINVLNPKLSIFFVAFLPQFISPDDAAPMWSMLGLSGVFMLMTFVVFIFYGLFASMMRERVIGNQSLLKWLRRSFAAAFGALAVKLALTER